MAARRLVIIMVVLLVVSTAVAIILPNEPGGDGDERDGSPPVSGTTGATGATGTAMPSTEGDEGAAGDSIVEASVDASAKRPKTVAVMPGDRLVLSVSADEGLDVAIPKLGLYGTATEHAPAVFDVLVREAGTFPVRVLGASEPVGTVRSGRLRPHGEPKLQTQPRPRRGGGSGAAGG